MIAGEKGSVRGEPGTGRVQVGGFLRIIAIGGEECPLVGKVTEASKAVYEEPACILKVLKVVQRGDKIVHWVRGWGEPIAVRRLIHLIKTLEGHQLVAMKEFRNGFMMVFESPLLTQCKSCLWLSNHPCIYVSSAVIMPGGKVLEYVASCRQRDVVDYIRQAGLRIVSTEEYTGEAVILTPRQEAALLKAFEYGYFKHPRRIHLDELARELDVAPSTLASLLSRAVEKVVNYFVLKEHPFVFFCVENMKSPLERCIELIKYRGVEPGEEEEEE